MGVWRWEMGDGRWELEVWRWVMGTLYVPEISTNDAVTIAFTGIKSKGELFIYDLTGRLMQQTHLRPEEKSITVHTGSYPAGVYIVVLREAGVLVSQHKLMKN